MKKLILLVAILLLTTLSAYAQGGCLLKQSTASQEIGIGPFVDSSDGDTSQTGLTIANTDVRLKKGGADWASKNSGGGTHEEAGWYRITLDATDTATLGILEISVHVSGALEVHKTCLVTNSGYYDVAVTTGPATTPFDAHVVTIANNAITSSSIDDDAVGASKIAADAIGASEIAPSAINPSEAPYLDAAISTRAAPAVKRNTGFQWLIQMVTTALVPVTSGTPSCTRSIDAPGTFSATTNTPSALNSDGLSELTLSNADMNGTDYVVLKCTVSGARTFYEKFRLQAP